MMSETLSGIHEKFALPTPSRMPATGRTETGSIMHLPIFWRSENAVLKLSMLVFRLGNEGAHFLDGRAFERAPGEVATVRGVEPTNLCFHGRNGREADTELVDSETDEDRD